ncbi:MAG: hypothetical protein LBV18_03985 [Alistipes sp.]|jgi:hypothetical protein|nr:hypothetical protein [Alistipes sp.]
MRELYRNAAGNPENTFTFDNEALAASLERIYRQKFDPKKEIDEDLFNAIREVLDDGIQRGFTSVAGDRYQDFLSTLKGNASVFAAFKTHRMQNDVAGQLLDENGELKSFAQFKADTAGVVGHHVDRWLKTEYDTAVIRAHHAADWQQFEREKDILPNLRWNKSTSLEPRASHRLFWGHIWPIDDPFWAQHRPGDEWGCKCSLSSTDEAPTDNTFGRQMLPKPLPGLGGNPGVTGKVFSDDHPYVKNAYKGAKQAVDDLLRRLNIAIEEVVERKFKSGGVLQMPKGLQQNAVEQKSNIKGYTELAKMHGERYKLLNVVNEHGRKNPDAYNLRTGRYSDMKSPQTDNGKNAIQASIKSAAAQRVGEVYIVLEKEYPRRTIYEGLKAALQGNRARSVKDIIIRFPDGELRRYDADKLRAVIK